ncbi:MAG: globin-coupled sensor protein, partial [Hyphomicrobiales bacterium]|nr:globin-coupled sensor protein [Hyphomicrobiales bacterium]
MLDMDLAISTYLDALNESRRKVEEAQAEGVRQQMLALDTIRQSLSQMAAGNMTTRLDANLAPEFDGLKHDFNKTAEKLNDVIVAVIASMGVIESGNSELAQASDDL